MAHCQRNLAAGVSIYRGLGGGLEQPSMQISDVYLAFVESGSILDPVTPQSSMSAICNSNSLSFHPVYHEATPWKLALTPVACSSLLQDGTPWLSWLSPQTHVALPLAHLCVHLVVGSTFAAPHTVNTHQ